MLVGRGLSAVTMSREVSAEGAVSHSLARSASLGPHYGHTVQPAVDSLSRRTTLSSGKRTADELAERAVNRVIRRLLDVRTYVSDPLILLLTSR